jgi:hypothetical protein
MKQSLLRRVERIESILTPPTEGPGMIVIISTPGMPDEIRVVPSLEPPRQRRTRRAYGDR